MSEENIVKMRPILFSGAMVRAILGGGKTQTRRVVKPQPDGVMMSMARSLGNRDVRCIAGKEGMYSIFCPYGKPGDGLWVRETFAEVTGPNRDEDAAEFMRMRLGVTYAADWLEKAPFAWRPSIFMPRWASRLDLEVVEIRLERLQDISEEDALAEGIRRVRVGRYQEAYEWDVAADCEDSAVMGYRRLWEKINGADSWAENPFVWVVCFHRLSTAV